MLWSARSDNSYFIQLAGISGVVTQSAQLLSDMIEATWDKVKLVEAIKLQEHEFEQRLNKMLKQLKQSFITPIDREDIFMLSQQLNNTQNLMQAAMYSLMLCGQKKKKSEVRDAINLVGDACRVLTAAVKALKNIKKSHAASESSVKLKNLCREGNKLLNSGLSSLFLRESAAAELIKWSRMYDSLSEVFKAFITTACILEGIILKNE